MSNYCCTFAGEKKNYAMKIKTTELICTSQSWDGAALPDFPQGHPELRVIRLDFPVGAKTGWHHHTVVNYGIVQQGDLTIVCQDGSERTFHEGEALVEVIGTIHRGENRGKKPVILNMFYFSAPGAEITIQHPELEQEENPKPLKVGRLIPVSKMEQRVQKMVLTLGNVPMTRRELMDRLGLKQGSRRIFIYNYFKPAVAQGYVKLLMGHIPNVPEQAYRLTEEGLKYYKQLKKEP